MWKLFKQHADVFLILFMLVSGALLFLVETAFNAGFSETVKYLAGPWAVIIFGLAAVHVRRAPHLKRQYWTVAILLYPLAVLFSWGYFIALNSIGIYDETVVFSGPVTAVHVSNGGKDPSTITMHDANTNKTVEFWVSQRQAEEVDIGATYRLCFYSGRFGIPFVWRFSELPQC